MSDDQQADSRVYTFKRLVIILGVLMFVVFAGGTSIMVITGMTGMPGTSVSEPLPDLSPSERLLAGRLESHVRFLSEEIGERNMRTEGSMEAAVDYIDEVLRSAGHTPERHRYEFSDHWRGRLTGNSADNLIIELPGTVRPDEIVIIGTHYDSVPGSPGANGSASGVAVLLELAQAFRDRPQPQTLRFIAFANGKAPFYMTDDMGSYVYATRSRVLEEYITAMIAIDGVGYYSNQPRSQHYPLPGMGLLYPHRGNFIGFITRLRDTALMHKALGAFREAGTLPSEGAALPAGIPVTGWSDHWSFWQYNYRALVVTDTMHQRYPHFHGPGDTPDRLDYDRMARLTLGLPGVIEELAQ